MQVTCECIEYIGTGKKSHHSDTAKLCPQHSFPSIPHFRPLLSWAWVLSDRFSIYKCGFVDMYVIIVPVCVYIKLLYNNISINT